MTPFYPRYPTYPQVDFVCATRAVVRLSLRGQERPGRKRTESSRTSPKAEKRWKLERAEAAGSGWRGDPRKKREATAARPMPLPLSRGSPAEPGDSLGNCERETGGTAMFQEALDGDPSKQQCFGRATREGEKEAERPNFKLSPPRRRQAHLGAGAANKESGGWRQR